MERFNRTERRAKNELIKAKRSKYHASTCLKSAGLLLNTATRCSCFLCGNPRRHFGQRTVQEESLLQKPLHDEL